MTRAASNPAPPQLPGGALRLILWLCGAVAILAAAAAPAQPAAASKEYQIKAAFLFNFCQFVEWPAAAFPDTQAPFQIGILGEDPFGASLEDTIRGERIQGHPLTVKRAQRVEDLKDCQLVFISKSERAQWPDILAKLEAARTLTVSEVEGFARAGGGINLYLDGNKVRFEINPGAAQRGGRRVSSQLLSVAKIVTPAAPHDDP